MNPEFLMDDIVNRFCIVNSATPIQKAETNNYPAINVFSEQVEKQILTELSEGSTQSPIINEPSSVL